MFMGLLEAKNFSEMKDLLATLNKNMEMVINDIIPAMKKLEAYFPMIEEMLERKVQKKSDADITTGNVKDWPPGW